MRKSILLVEDDESLGFLLKETLMQQDWSVNWQTNGAEGIRSFHQGTYDLIILDVMLPAIDGFTIAELIRERDKTTPLLFLTAKSLTKDVLKGFAIGADDYIRKPIAVPELIARINAVFRRYAIAASNPQSTEYQIGKYIFDRSKQQLQYQEDIRQLTEKEAELLWILYQNKGNLVLRDDILKHIWGKADFFNRKSMDVFLSRLRKYFKEDNSVIIQNVRGRGFILNLK